MNNRTPPSGSFALIATQFLDEPGVAEGTGFGKMPGLTVDSRIFAMLVRDELVLKLPAQRSTQLVEAGEARPFQVGKRTMREWIAVEHAREDEWPALAHEALAFVAGLRIAQDFRNLRQPKHPDALRTVARNVQMGYLWGGSEPRSRDDGWSQAGAGE